MDEEQDKAKNRKSAAITATIQVVLLVVLYFLAAWRQPDPPIPEYGIELSFGVATGGSNVAPQPQPVTTPPTQVENAEEQPTEPASSSESQSTEGDEAIEEPTEGDLPIEETGEPDASDAESEEATPSESNESDEAAESDQTEEQVTPPVIQQPVQEVTEDATPASEESDAESAGVGNDAGDEVQGEPAAEIDERALYGNVTGQEGASLQMSGWIWDFEPTPQDDSQESGKIVYKVTIDDEGYILSVVPQTSTVSPSVEKYYRQAVEALTFSKTSSYKTAPTSTGTITFIIKTK